MAAPDRRSLRFLSPAERLADLGLDAALLATGGLGPDAANRLTENAIGTFALPLGVAVDLVVNGRAYLVPMATEEASIVAAQCKAAKAVAQSGGFASEATDPLAVAQIGVVACRDPESAVQRIADAAERLRRAADAQLGGLVRRGGGCREVLARLVRHPDDDEAMVMVHLVVDVRDAMGANAVNGLAEALAEEVAELCGGRALLRIVSNGSHERRVRTTCRLTAEAALSLGAAPADIVLASRFAEADPERAATHNKGILNGVDALAVATGNDWRAIEAAAHSFAARGGRYSPLSRWREDGGHLAGTLELPVPLGTVGGMTVAHPLAARMLALLGVTSARELAEVAGAVGLAQNLAALAALASEGICRGHRRLHERRTSG